MGGAPNKSRTGFSHSVQQTKHTHTNTHAESARDLRWDSIDGVRRGAKPTLRRAGTVVEGCRGREESVSCGTHATTIHLLVSSLANLAHTPKNF